MASLLYKDISIVKRKLGELKINKKYKTDTFLLTDHLLQKQYRSPEPGRICSLLYHLMIQNCATTSQGKQKENCKEILWIVLKRKRSLS